MLTFATVLSPVVGVGFGVIVIFSSQRRSPPRLEGAIARVLGLRSEKEVL